MFNKQTFAFGSVAVVVICLTIISSPLYSQMPVEQKQLPQPKKLVRRLQDISEGRSQHLHITDNTYSNPSPTTSSNASFSDHLLDSSSIDLNILRSDQLVQDILYGNNSRAAGDGVILTSHTEDTLNDHSPAANACPDRIPVSKWAPNVDGSRPGSGIPTELYNMAPEVFDIVPSKFIKGARIPCWKTTRRRKGTGGEVLCLPSFFLAGIPKCGTTDLWEKIMAHPDVIESRRKEPHWWPRHRIKSTDGRLSVLKYARRYKNAAYAIQKRPDISGKLVAGDGSASTFWDNQKWHKYFPEDACKDGPPYVIADVIRYVLPKSKIVVIFRNPTDRLYSGYSYFGNRKRTEFTFHDDVTDAINMFNKCVAKMSRRACAYSPKQYYNSKLKVRLHVGLYSIYVRDWLNSFPRDQLMFLRLEDWHTECRTLLPQVHDFLQLEPQTRQRISNTCSQKRQNPTKRKPGTMLDKTRRILDDFYASTRRELADLLQDDKYLWQ